MTLDEKIETQSRVRPPVVAPEPAPVPLTSRRAGWRPDIEAMRGLAVAAVVLYHAGVPGFAGGYVGVDVFFVLSGFLITGLVTRERTKSGSIDLVGFYARRIRRLLPASVLVFATTIVGCALMLPVLRSSDLGGQARATAVFGSNIWLANNATNYLSSADPSPFQQYWSLAVEEQFYLLWPILVLAVLLGVRDHAAIRRRMLGFTAAVVVGSLALSMAVTPVNQPWAFFMLPTRAWELAAGGLLAMAGTARLERRTGARSVLGALGLAAVAASVVTFSAGTVFPGWAAVLPVAGTLAMIAAGAGSGSGFSHALDRPVLRLLGRYSYSLYLWHWPVLILPEAAWGPLPMRARALLVVLSLGLAAATFHLVENRVRFARRLVASPRRTIAVGVTLTALALGTTALLAVPKVLATEDDGSISSGIAAVPAGEPSPYVPRGLHPAIEDALDIQPAVYADGCHLEVLETEVPPCVYGAPGGGVEVLVTGDSHASHWFPALDAAAREHGWRLRSVTKSSCPPVILPELVHTRLGRPYAECVEFNRTVTDQIRADPPDLVILSAMSWYYSAKVGNEDWLDALSARVTELSELTDVVVLRDTPAAEDDVPVCLAENLEDVSPCLPRVTDHALDVTTAEADVVTAAGGRYVDPIPLVCPGAEDCPVILGDVLLYSDDSHLTTEFTKGASERFYALLTG